MSVTAARLREIAETIRGPIEQQLDASEILAAAGRICRDEGIDYGQLKALVKAQIRDDRDETGDGGYVEKIIEKADAASAYADMLANMNEKNISDEPSRPDAVFVRTTNPVTVPIANVGPCPGDVVASWPDAEGIPDFLRRNPDNSVPA